MNKLGPYREATVIAAIALLAWLLLIPGADTGTETRLLAESVPEQITVTLPDQAGFIIDLSHQPPVLRTTDQDIIGRMWPREVRAVREALSTCTILTTRSLDNLPAETLAEFGLEHPAAIQWDDQVLQVGSSRLDRGYAITDGTVLILNQDLGGLIARSPSALRDPSLGLDNISRIELPDNWFLSAEFNRWWLANSPETDQRSWTDPSLMQMWLHELATAQVLGFAPEPDTSLVRAHMTIHTNTDNETNESTTIKIEDLGPAEGEGRLIARHHISATGTIIEHLVTDLDPVLVAPAPQHLRSRTLIPLNPLDAQHVSVGNLTLTRSNQRWAVNNYDDGDQNAIDTWLRQLSTLPTAAADPNAPSLTVIDGDLRFELEHGSTALAQLAATTTPLSLRHRFLLPHLEPETVTALVLQPRDDAPVIFNRERDDAWDATDKPVVESFLAALRDAEVTRWSAMTTAAEASSHTFSHTVTIASAKAGEAASSQIIHLDADGTVFIPHRELMGVLTAGSRRAILGR